MFTMVPYRRSNRTPSLFDDRVFRSFFDLAEPFGNAGFRVDIRDQGDGYLLEAELPGVKQEEIELSVDNDVLTISANRKEEKKEEKDNYLYCERRSGHTQRSFSLEGIDQEKIQAKYENGILNVTLPKIAPETPKTPKRIEIQ